MWVPAAVRLWSRMAPTRMTVRMLDLRQEARRRPRRRLPRLTISGHSPSVPAPSADEGRADVWYGPDGSVAAWGEVGGRGHVIHMTGVASFRFDLSSDAVVADAGPGRPAWLIRDAFYRFILPLVLQVRGCEVLHASAIRAPGGVVALCGVSETGKSTLARALAERGHAIWADDAVVFENARSGVRALPVPFILRLLPDARSFFQPIASPVDAKEEPVPMRPGRRWAPLAAVFLLERSGGPTRPSRLGAGAAFADVLEHARCFAIGDAERRRRLAEHYLDLVRRVPVYRVRFRTGFEHLRELVEHVERVVSELGGGL